MRLMVVHRSVVLAGLSVACIAALATAADRGVADAAERQDWASVRRLVAARADVNAVQGDGTTALHWAAHWNDQQTASLLVQAGAKVNAATDQGITPLHLAAVNATKAMLDLLLRSGANPNAASIVGETPLMTAAETGHLDGVALLLERGADVSAAETSAGQTALMRAVAGNHLDVARALLAKAADVKARSKNQFTPLLFAAQQGNLEMVKLLVAAGADVNESAADGIGGDTNARLPFKPNTSAGALMVAIDSAPEREPMLRLRRGDVGTGDSRLDAKHTAHEDVAMYLLTQGADPNENGAGRTPIHSAIQRQMPRVVEMLLDYGADPNARLERGLPAVARLGVNIPSGSTPFMLAANYTDLDMMRLLVKRGADPLRTSRDKTTALMLAAGLNMQEGMDKYGRRWFLEGTEPLQQAAQDAVKLCLELGLDINGVNDAGQAAIMAGVYFGGTAMTRFLVAHGADVNVKNKKGQTPWSIATYGEYHAGSFMVHKDTAAVLEELGADTKLGIAAPPPGAEPQ